MSDTDREQIERGIASIGYFDIDNCTCDPSVGVYPCHYCAECEAIMAGQRVLERLAAADALNCKLLEFVECQCCECYDEYGKDFPYRCPRCQLLDEAKGG